MAYGDMVGGLMPFPGAPRRDALLELLGTPGISAEFTTPIYNQFMSDRTAAQQSRQDYLSQMLATLLGSATEGQSARQAGMLSDALQSAYGIRPQSPLIGKVQDITSSLYPERRNPLKVMPGGLSPLATNAPVSYEDVLATNARVKAGVAAGKSLQQITNEILNSVQSSFLNPNYAAPGAEGGVSAAVAAQMGTGEPQYIMPENWAAMKAQLTQVIERAYKEFAGQPGMTPVATTTPAEQPSTGDEGFSIGNFLTGLTNSDNLEKWLIGGLAGSGLYQGLKGYRATRLPGTPPPAAAAAAERAPVGELPAYGQTSDIAPKRTFPMPESELGAAQRSAAGQMAREEALGNLPTTSGGLTAAEVESKFGYKPGMGGLAGMLPIAISELAMNFGQDPLSQQAQLDAFRAESLPVSDEDAIWMRQADFDVWQDPATGQWYLYLPVGEM